MNRLFSKDIDAIHKVYHRFLKLFKSDHDEWKYYGYEFMQRVERWAKYYPNDVHVIQCDDEGHSSSIIVLIEHKSDKSWFGITLVMIPQNFGSSVSMFFYDNSTKNMIKVLKSILTKTRKLKQ